MPVKLSVKKQVCAKHVVQNNSQNANRRSAKPLVFGWFFVVHNKVQAAFENRFKAACTSGLVLKNAQIDHSAVNAVFVDGRANIIGNGFDFGHGIAHRHAESDGLQHFHIVVCVAECHGIGHC